MREEFRSYDQLLNVLSSRSNNTIMRTCHQSTVQGNEEWYGTKSYDDAVKLLYSGYVEVVDRMHKNVVKASELNSKYLSDVNHAVPHNAIVGYIPNVPAAIQNLPQSMISVDKKPMKRKTLEILYCMSGLCDKEQEYFENAGIAMLSAVDLIEKSGIQTRINLAFKASQESIGCMKEATMPTVMIKNYGERFSIQKVSFPLVHTSMFRRIGFKWLETSPDITANAFHNSYGISLTAKQCEKVFILMNKPNCALLGTAWINDHNCDVHEILKKLGVIT